MQWINKSSSGVLAPSHFIILPTHLSYILSSTTLYLILQTSKADINKEHVLALMTCLLETDIGVATSFGFSRKDEGWWKWIGGKEVLRVLGDQWYNVGVWGLVGRILGGPMTLPLGVTYLILYTAVSRKIMLCGKRDFEAVIMAINQLILRWENYLGGWSWAFFK